MTTTPQAVRPFIPKTQPPSPNSAVTQTEKNWLRDQFQAIQNTLADLTAAVKQLQANVSGL